MSEIVAGDPAGFDELLELADASVVNTLVFDTKTEAGDVLYESEVALATEIGAVRNVYDPSELIALARERGLYTITRIVTFEDDHWSDARPAASLAGTWMNAADQTNWAYPIDLAVESCQLGFDEIQFDYVRFPDGLAARRSTVPATMDERTGVIAEFLETARARLADEGCRTSAAVFGIITASATDEGIGQTVDALSGHVDALSPMLYPSHYGPGWIGYADPNDHPGPVIAHALDSAAPDLATGTKMQPWIQAFYYNGQQIQAQIAEAEQRGAGWMLWNYSGNYRADWVPALMMRRFAPIVALAVAALALDSSAACVADDETAATFVAESTLPPVTTAAADQTTTAETTATTTSTTTSTTTTAPLPELQGLDAELLAEGFDQPVTIAVNDTDSGTANDGAVYISEREGVIKVVAADGTVSVHADLSDRIGSSSIEQGLLGLAFRQRRPLRLLDRPRGRQRAGPSSSGPTPRSSRRFSSLSTSRPRDTTPATS